MYSFILAGVYWMITILDVFLVVIPSNRGSKQTENKTPPILNEKRICLLVSFLAIRVGITLVQLIVGTTLDDFSLGFTLRFILIMELFGHGIGGLLLLGDILLLMNTHKSRHKDSTYDKLGNGTLQSQESTPDLATSIEADNSRSMLRLFSLKNTIIADTSISFVLGLLFFITKGTAKEITFVLILLFLLCVIPSSSLLCYFVHKK